MGRICILTDNNAQFPVASFPGHDLVHVIPLHVRVNDQIYMEGKGIRAHNLPVSARIGLFPSVIPPSIDEFQHMYTYLGQICDEIVVLLVSSFLIDFDRRTWNSFFWMRLLLKKIRRSLSIVRVSCSIC